MNIGILTDSYKFPNLALMKISAYYKQAEILKSYLKKMCKV